MKRLFPIFAVLTGALLSYALYQALVVAPTDALQGDVYRIIFYHVSSAWTAFLFFTINFVASVVYLIRRNDKADVIAAVTAEVGVVFCTVVLVTGPLWARPVWGIWWTWDMRLTSTLV
ncbi:MAG TPA: cytochrome c biogenesis protein, partial [Terriglobales bacterium]|nr:cytochrome c biogenesis protein [Terriglobales bacterium]